jgi:L-amino acid N-acyltransferase YncA
VLVAARDSVVIGWARISPYSSRPCYAGVGEGSIYVRESERGRGVGGTLATALREAAAPSKVGRSAVLRPAYA